MNETEAEQPTALAAERLAWRCEPQALPFDSTATLPDVPGFVGQARAEEAIRFAARIEGPGYNAYVMGPSGFGKHTVVQRLLATEAATRPAPADWCYVHSFSEPRRPRAISLAAGRGGEFRRDMAEFRDDLQATLPAAFESDSYRQARARIDADFEQRFRGFVETLAEEARSRGLKLIETPQGLALVPARDDEPMTEEQFRELPEAQREAAGRHIAELSGRLRAELERMPEWQMQRRQRIRELDRSVTETAIRGLIGRVRAQYADHARITEYLGEAERDLIESPIVVRRSDGAPMLLGALESVEHAERRGRFEVNLIVGRAAGEGAPVVYESNPTLANLIGHVEHVQQLGALTTDLTMIRAGALHRANGGYLIVDAERLLRQPLAWEALKRALLARELRIESLGQALSLISTMSIEPEPIALDVKVALVGPRLLYYLLAEYDADFPALVKVVADFDEHVDRTAESLSLYAQLLATLARQAGLRPLDREGTARTIEHAARLAGDSERLSMQVGAVRDLLREADYHALGRGAAQIGGADVQHAIEAQRRRVDRVQRELLAAIANDTLRIATAGETVGQANGLAVLALGGAAFAHPVRITATASMGEGELIDIEREVKLGGATHSKGVLILSSFVAARYGGSQPLSLRASLCFEQSYGGVDGDSASLAEVCALLSALSDLPLRQDRAITGSVNQHGTVQAVGAINEKIEGFFDVCARRGLVAGQGVIIPADNVRHLMLRPEVIEAVRAGRFAVWAVATVDEALTLLTGRVAGARDAAGHFPAASVNAAVEARLRTFTRRRLQLAREFRPRGQGIAEE